MNPYMRGSCVLGRDNCEYLDGEPVKAIDEAAGLTQQQDEACDFLEEQIQKTRQDHVTTSSVQRMDPEKRKRKVLMMGARRLGTVELRLGMFGVSAELCRGERPVNS